MLRNAVCPFCFSHISIEKGECCPEESCLSKEKKIPIPDQVFDHELFPIVVVGGTGTGKTAYLTALAWAIENDKFWGQFWEVKKISFKPDPFDGLVGQMFNSPYKFPEPTETEADHWPLLISIKPLKWAWTLKRWILDFPHIIPQKILLCFTDPAGEHCNLTATTTKDLFFKYPVLRGHTKALIALMDPLEVPKWENKLLKYRGLSLYGSRATITTSINCIHQTMPDSKKLPIAVCLTKLDELVDDDSRLDPADRIKSDGDGLFNFGHDYDTYKGENGRLSSYELEKIDHEI